MKTFIDGSMEPQQAVECLAECHATPAHERVEAAYRRYCDLPPLLDQVEESLRKHIGQTTTIPHGAARGLRWVHNGMRYFNALYAAGLWDDDIQAILEATLMPGDTFFDVGAHCGFHTLGAAARVGQSGHVYAFEAAPARVADIQRHKDANGLSQVTVVPMAVSEVDGAEVSFYVYEAASGLSSLRHPGIDGASQVNVETVSLDEFAEKEGEKGFPKLIKVDIEGAEHLALRGAEGLLARPKPPTWLIELHYEDAAREVLYLLERAGYDVRTTDGAAVDMTVIRQLSPLRLVEHIIAVHPSSPRVASARAATG